MIKRSDEWRTLFHIMPQNGWINDPNGLCYFNGMYHAFFQNRPENAYGTGAVYWGHCVSKDLIRWSYMDNSIAPDTQYDRDGAYSGSALIENDKIKLFYTGNVKEKGDYDYIYSGRQANTMTIESSDGITFSGKKCLMMNKDYPENISCHIRDPKVWKKDNEYYMVQGARTKDDVGEAVLFTSVDGVKWNYKNVFRTKEPFGYMWECPDIFEMKCKKVLSVCPQGVAQMGFDYANIYQSGYFFINEKSELSPFTEWDRGFDFYAPQTFVDSKGRRIMIAWMGVPDADEHINPTVKYGWQHILTFPRELTISKRNGKNVICQKPVEEINLLRKKCQKIEVDKHYLINKAFDAVFEIKVEDIFSETQEKLSYEKKTDVWGVWVNKQFNAEYNIEEKIFKISFVNGDNENLKKENIGYGRTERTVLIEEVVKCEIIYDVSCVEIFLNDGEVVLSTRIYPEDNVDVQFYGEKIDGILWNIEL